MHNPPTLTHIDTSIVILSTAVSQLWSCLPHHSPVPDCRKPTIDISSLAPLQTVKNNKK